MTVTFSSPDEGPKKVVAADGHEYHVSSTANAKTAPTNENTKQNAGKDAGLGFEASQFCTLMDMEWNLHKNVTKDYIQEHYGYTDEEWKVLTTNPSVISNLIERGIDPHQYITDIPNPPKSPLTPIQLVVANQIMDLNDNKSIKQKLQNAGVSTYQYQAWLRDPNFNAYCKARAEALLGDVEHEVLLALTDRAVNGDTKSIELWLEINGRHTRASTAATVGGSAHNTEIILMRVIEIVLDEVDDQDTANRIAEKLKSLAVGANVAGALSSAPEIITPEVMPNRVLSAKMKEAVSHGVGVDN
jgi:hypothetical protein